MVYLLPYVVGVGRTRAGLEKRTTGTSLTGGSLVACHPAPRRLVHDEGRRGAAERRSASLGSRLTSAKDAALTFNLVFTISMPREFDRGEQKASTEDDIHRKRYEHSFIYIYIYCWPLFLKFWNNFFFYVAMNVA